MPRVSKDKDKEPKKKRKNTKKDDIENTINTEPEPIIIQLPINTENINSLNDNNINVLEYDPILSDPEPYNPINTFCVLDYETEKQNNNVVVNNNIFSDEQEQDSDNKNNIEYKNCCYWCCHPIKIKEFGMPIKYDAYYKTFTTFGNFCSLECIAAYNFSTHNGSDRMWEIHSWIQMIAEQVGIETPIRPAPSRYLLKMFNGPMDIEEFRNAHQSGIKTYIMNMPPMVHVPSQLEVLNTSYITNSKNNITTTDNFETKIKLTRKKEVIDIKKSLDTKMNLTIKKIE